MANDPPTPDQTALEEQLMDCIAQYQEARTYDEKMRAFELVVRMAQQDYVGACYVAGTCLLGEGPCGDGFFERDTEKATHYLQRAHELGDPIAKTFLETH